MSDVRFTHIGGPTVLIEVAGWRILTDPTFDPPGRRYFFGWGTMSRKLAGPSIAPADLGPIDAILVSHHHHADNLDPAGVALLPSAGTVLTTSKAARTLGHGALPMAPWDTHTLESPGRTPVTITATPCRHGPAGSEPITGPVIGFALRWDGQEHGQLWMTGDTVLYPGLRYSMDAREAVGLLDLVAPTHVVPVHYEGWSHFSQGRRDAEQVLASSAHAGRVRWLDLGEAATITV